MLGKASAGEMCSPSRAAQRNGSVGESMDPRILLSPQQTSPCIPQTPPLPPKVPKRVPVVMAAVDIGADSQQHSCCCPQLSHDSRTEDFDHCYFIIFIISFIILISLSHSWSKEKDIQTHIHTQKKKRRKKRMKNCQHGQHLETDFPTPEQRALKLWLQVSCLCSPIM